MNHIKVTIAGVEYKIASDESAAYVAELARELDRDIRDLTDGNSRLSTAAAAVLCALERADKAKKASADADNLREQLSKALNENDVLRSQISTGQLRF